jgi:lipopolysaccharide export system protein LptA
MKGMYLTSALLLWCTLGMSTSLLSQDTLSNDAGKKEVEILNADLLHFVDTLGKKYTYLEGNVQLKQETTLLYCDKASISKADNTVEAWGHVHIQNDTVNTYSDYLLYNSLMRYAILRTNAIVTDGAARVTSSELHYSTRDKIASYDNWGKIYRKKTVITSHYGTYYSSAAEALITGNVVVLDPEYRITSDTLKYLTNTDVTVFYHNTTIYNKKSRIHCESGSFDTKQNQGRFGKKTKIIDGTQILTADSLFFDRDKNYGKAYWNFHWLDSTMDFELFGNKGEFYNQQERFKAWDNAFLISKMDRDSLYLSADTLYSHHTSASDTTRVFRAFYHARMYSKQMQAICDSMKYSFADSTFRMYKRPVVWTDSTQMLGDTIYLKLKNKKADRLYLLNAAFIIMPTSKKYFDQIKAKNITGYFKDNELERMQAEGNAESIYFGKNDKNKLLGANKSLCINMWLYFKDKKVSKVVFIQKPEAVFTPIKMMSIPDMTLKNFDWQYAKRPISREDIMGDWCP